MLEASSPRLCLEVPNPAELNIILGTALLQCKQTCLATTAEVMNAQDGIGAADMINIVGDDTDGKHQVEQVSALAQESYSDAFDVFMNECKFLYRCYSSKISDFYQ